MGFFVQGHQSKPQRPALGPFKVVGECPVVITSHVSTLADDPLYLGKVAEEEAGTLIVVGVGQPVFSDIDGLTQGGDLFQHTVHSSGIDFAIGTIAPRVTDLCFWCGLEYSGTVAIWGPQVYPHSIVIVEPYKV